MLSASSSLPASTEVKAEAPAPSEDWQAGGFGVYVHWPFCAAKCPYCDFNSHVRPAVEEARWRYALVTEVGRLGAELPGRTADSVFFGGGTPSLMSPGTVAAVLDAIRATWRLAPDAEITLEANPTSVEAARFRGYAGAGVNRLSLGVQALDDEALRQLGRRHSVAEAEAAFALARAVFPRVSFDLIYARPGQTAASWAVELDRALGMAVDHLSLYQLTIEPGTRFWDLRARGGLGGLPAPMAAAELYELTRTACAAAGLAGYEVSNFARQGAESRHNLVYWRYGDYAGIGPGAHGRLTCGAQRWAVECRRAPEDWLAAVAAGGSGESRREELVSDEQGVEMLMMGLRLAEGVDLGRFARLTGRPIGPARMDELVDLGLVAVGGGRLRVTEGGLRVLDAVLERLLD